MCSSKKSKTVSANLFRRVSIWVSNIKMVEYDRIDIWEGIDIKKSNASKECKICIIGILKILVLNINHIFLMVVMV